MWVFHFGELTSDMSRVVCLTVCGPAEPVKQSMTSSLWFIIILCLLALLFLVLLIVFLIRYNRGAKYKVYEKEKRHGAKGGRIDEEDQFCEYIRRSVVVLLALSASILTVITIVCCD